MSILTEEFEESTEDDEAAIVELVVAAIVEFVVAIVSVVDGFDTIKSFDTLKKHRELQRTLDSEKEDRRTQRERD